MIGHSKLSALCGEARGNHFPSFGHCTAVALLLLSLMLVLPFQKSFAQKEYRPIKTALKENKNLSEALKAVDKLAKTEKFKADPQLYDFGLLINKRLNDAQNEKAYLKQRYDTAQLFSTDYEMFMYSYKCDSVETTLRKNGRENHRVSNKRFVDLQMGYRNLLSAGRYYLLRKDFSKALKFLSLYVAVPSWPIVARQPEQTRPVARKRAYYWACVAAYSLRDTAFFNFSPVALADTLLRPQLLEMQYEMLLVKGDTARAVDELSRSLAAYPNHTYFFTHLVDHYNNKGQYQKSLEISEKARESSSDSTHVMQYAESLALLNLGRDEESIDVSKDLLKKDTTYVETFFNIGIAYCNIAHKLEQKILPDMPISNLRRQRSLVNDNYQKAMPYLEHYRKLQPEALSKWGVLLYRVYLSLNKDRKFREIDALLQKSDASK